MKSHLQYLRYLIRHKWYVYLAGRKLGAPLWRLIIHDWSKFLPSEWTPYVRRFYQKPVPHPYGNPVYNGPSEMQKRHWEADTAALFDKAWLLHQNRQPHHWQFWVLINDDDKVHYCDGIPFRAIADEKALPMPQPLVCEMVADWAGAGRAITGRWEVADWYEKNRHKMVLHPSTRRRAEFLIQQKYRPATAA